MDQVANTAYGTFGKTLFMKQDVCKLAIGFDTSGATFVLIIIYFRMV
jgi:hypothetical protein